MRIPENLCMLLPKALKMRAIKHTMALITDSIGSTKCAPAQMPWYLRHVNPALLNRQGMSTNPKMENGSELCHWKGQLVIGLRAYPVRPRKPPQIGAKLGTPRGSASTTWRNEISMRKGRVTELLLHSLALTEGCRTSWQ